LPPIGTTITHNNVYNSLSSNLNVDVDLSDTAMDITWRNNLMNQGKYSNFTFNSTQIITGKDPKLTLAGTSINMYEPSSGSALLNYITGDYGDILFDIRGRSRETNAKVPGASQISGAVSKTMPTKTTVGSTILYNTSTGLSSKTEESGLNISISNKKICLLTRNSGIVTIFNLSGQALALENVNTKSYISSTLNNGIYIVTFITKSGIRTVQKILVN
jgi:hypothetical protein